MLNMLYWVDFNGFVSILFGFVYDNYYQCICHAGEICHFQGFNFLCDVLDNFIITAKKVW